MKFEQKIIRFLYHKLLAFYPRSFRDQFGESMKQTFNDLYRERKQQAKKQGLLSFAGWMFIETSTGIIKEHFILFKKGETIKSIMISHKSATITAFLLALPFTVLLSITAFNIEPLNSSLRTLLISANSIGLNVLGKTVIIGTLLLLPAAFTISLMPIVHSIKAGKRAAAFPINLFLSIALLGFISLIVGHLINAQYLCWMRGICD